MTAAPLSAPNPSDTPILNDPDPAEALGVYLATRPDGWPDPKSDDALSFFASAFELEPAATAFCTGYYEPEIAGALRPSDRFRHPIYRMPPSANLPDRASIEAGALKEQGFGVLTEIDIQATLKKKPLEG